MTFELLDTEDAHQTSRKFQDVTMSF